MKGFDSCMVLNPSAAGFFSEHYLHNPAAAPMLSSSSLFTTTTIRLDKMYACIPRQSRVDLHDMPFNEINTSSLLSPSDQSHKVKVHVGASFT